MSCILEENCLKIFWVCLFLRLYLFFFFVNDQLAIFNDFCTILDKFEGEKRHVSEFFYKFDTITEKM